AGGQRAVRAAPARGAAAARDAAGRRARAPAGWGGASARRRRAAARRAPPPHVLDLLPSTWLARFWTDGWNADANLRRLGVLGLFACSAALFALQARDAAADRLFETTSHANATHTT